MKGYSVLAIILLGVVFFTCLSGHLEVGMPMHVDSWGTISFADFIIKQQKVPTIEPFSGLELNQPVGFALFQACISLESGISLLQQSVYLPAILNVILAMMLYILAKELFDKNKITIIRNFKYVLTISYYYNSITRGCLLPCNVKTYFVKTLL